MARFRLQSGEVDAVQFDGRNWIEMITFTGTRKNADGDEVPTFSPVVPTMLAIINSELADAKAMLWMETVNKMGYVKPGDWVVKGTLIRTGGKGFHLMKDELFRELYEPVEES